MQVENCHVDMVQTGGSETRVRVGRTSSAAISTV